MDTTAVELIYRKKNTVECQVWSQWLSDAAKLVDRHISIWPDDDPFSYNENASSAFLAAAGAVAGYVTMAEVKTQKLRTEKADRVKVQRRERHGRADLWLHTAQKNWAFEFKQRLSVGVSRADGRLESYLRNAEACADDIIKKNDGQPVAGLIVSLYFVESDEAADQAGRVIKEFCSERCDFCWRLTPPAGRRPTYLMFKLR